MVTKISHSPAQHLSHPIKSYANIDNIYDYFLYIIERGPVAPFDVSLICLTIGSAIILFAWTENTGDSNLNLSSTISNAFQRLKEDRKIMLLGIIQSFFEGAMYVFVFMWTPALAATNNKLPIYHGWIFASFMVCVLIGSGLFQYFLQRGLRVEKVALYMFATAAVALFVPALVESHTVRLLSFFVFECCVGLFWPSMGFMRSRYVPEEVRSTTMNFFRIPLNCIVVIVLYNIASLSDFQVFMLCFLCLMPALLAQFALNQIVFSAAEVNKKLTQEEIPLTQISSH
jgi:MFS family permease